MDNFIEKKYLYEQMQSILEERRILSKTYIELQERLAKLDQLTDKQQVEESTTSIFYK